MGPDSTRTIAEGKSSKAGRNGRCQRRSERHACKERPRVGLVKAGDKAKCEALVRDIASQGMGLLLVGPLEPGINLTVHFDLNGRQRSIPAQVRHATKQADGSFLVGLWLSRALDHEELVALRDRVSSPASADKPHVVKASEP